MIQKIKSMLGFAAKSGNISFGQEQVLKNIRSGKANLVFVAEDTSSASKKKIIDKCVYYGTEYIVAFDRDELSKCIGKTSKTCLSVNDKEFAKVILKYYETLLLEEIGN